MLPVRCVYDYWLHCCYDYHRGRTGGSVVSWSRATLTIMTKTRWKIINFSKKSSISIPKKNHLSRLPNFLLKRKMVVNLGLKSTTHLSRLLWGKNIKIYLSRLVDLKKTRKNQDIDFSRKSRFSGNYVVIFKTTVLVGYLIFLRNFWSFEKLILSTLKIHVDLPGRFRESSPKLVMTPGLYFQWELLPDHGTPWCLGPQKRCF